MTALSRRLLLCGMLTLPAACAPAASGGSSTTSTATRGSADVITAEEIARTDAVDAYRAIERLRPSFLRSRSGQGFSGAGTPVVYVNGQRWGALESLRNLPAAEVVTVQRLSASEAQTRYGLDNVGGVVDVKTRGGGRP